jgi:hypothetical protein
VLALTNDSSAPDGPETLAVTDVGTPSHGTSTVHPVHGIRYTPSAQYNGPDAFTYTISDGNGGTDTATINVIVSPVNDNPVAVTDLLSVNEDSADNTIDVLANDTMGVDTGETLSVSAITQPAHGATTLTAGVVRYAPVANYVGADTFTYTLSDGNGGTAIGTVNVTVTSANDNPTAVDDGVTVLEDSGSTSVAVLANDSIAPDTGETLAVTGVTQPEHGTATFTAANVGYAPAANYHGSDSFSYTIGDGNGGTDTGTVNVTITAVNDAPSFTKGANEIVLEEAGLQTVTGWATNLSAGPADEAAQTLSFTVTNDNNGLFSTQPAVASNGTLTYTPAANQYGTATVSVRINDNGGTANGGANQSAIQTFTIIVTGVNDVPSFTKGANQTDLEDAGLQTVAGWATAISAGPGEATQTVAFEITSTNAPCSPLLPAVSTAGTLTTRRPPTPTGPPRSASDHRQRRTANSGVDASAARPSRSP